MIHFDLPKEKSSIIKVIGVGGGGSNAVNHMFSQSIDGVNFIICNTDAQAISQSLVPNKIQLGPHLTQGLGAGANPKIGQEACEESLEEIKRILEVNTKMAFITAGMGGGTGTGGAPIIAKICKDLGILTVGIVTTPFAYEGKKRIAQAEEGIEKLKGFVDTLLVISNDKLRHQFGNLTMKAAFSKADNVLATAAKCITDVINSTGQINVDFADVCTVMRNGGVAILGSAAVEGENRAQKAIESALNSPLLNDNDIRGAKWILININSAEGENEFTMDEVETIQNHLLGQAGEDTDVILGLGYDNSLGEKIGITLIATGFEHKNPFDKKEEPKAVVQKEEKIIMVLENPEPVQKIVAKDDLLQQQLFPLAKEAMTEEAATLIQEAALHQTPVPPVLETDSMAPTLSEISALVKPEIEKIVEKKAEAPVYFEITSNSVDFNPTNDVILPTADSIDNSKQEADKPIHNIKEASTAQMSGSYLARPSQIYADEEATNKSMIVEEPPLRLMIQADEPQIEMQLVMKNSLEATEAQEDQVQQAQPIMMSTVEEPPLVDETEELKRRAMERIAKLRNLSFNINAADPNNEFETVPAYLRRNMELHNSIADVESFYSNYTVKSTPSNPAEISTINTFLDGKKPD